MAFEGLATSIQDVSGCIARVATATEEIAASTRELADRAGALQELVGRFTG